MMLKTTPALRACSRLKTRFDVEIAGIAIAVPDHALPQADAAQRAKRLFPDLAEYESPFRNTGIETRYTCQPAEWYEREHGWQERTDVFVHHALDLLEEVARSAIGAACIELKDIGAIVVNTITGLAIPSLDAKLMNRLDLPESVERLPIEFNGFLCHPGGAKVLKTVQSLLELRRDDLGYSWAVLRDFGNMSSPTALFTLDQALNAGASGPHLMAAFGPGFSAYFLAVEL
jgi:predicted naringenin-chalcone synthase